MDDKKIGIASDHAGYQLKEFIIGYLDSKGYDVHDFGCHSEESCDYPDYAHPLAEASSGMAASGRLWPAMHMGRRCGFSTSIVIR